MSYDPLFKKAGSERWWCRVPNPKGGRHLRRPTGQYDRSLALKRWREICREELARSGDVPREFPPLVEALERRIEERRNAGRAKGTLDMYDVKSGHLLRIFGEDTPLDQIDAAAVDDYIAQRLREDARPGEKTKPSTIHKELSVLRGTLRLARRRKEYPHALDEVMPLDFSPKYKPRERALSVGEVDLLLMKLPPKRAAVVAFLCATGATCPSEVEPWREGDARGTMVHLRGTKRETRDRWVPVQPWGRRWLRLALKAAPFEKWTNVRRDLHAACDELGIERCSPNDLRRTFGHQLRARGVAPHLIAVMMGHRDSRMAERVYARLQPAELAYLLRGPAGGQKRPRDAPGRRKTA